MSSTSYKPSASSTPHSAGQVSLQILIFSTVIVIMVTGFATWSGGLLNTSLHGLNKLNAFQIAEAGIEYYRWHLAHAPNDFWDGNGATSTGPYAHNYYDQDGNLLGTFNLTITPIPNTTIVKIRSAANLVADSFTTKTIEVRMGIPSWAQYSAVANSFLWFGPTEEVYGQVHSNAGIRLDGIAYNAIISALTTTNDPTAGGKLVWAVHTTKAPEDPMPPTPFPPRPDVFAGGRTISAPTVNFTGLTATLADLKTEAQSSGSYFASSTVLGYHMVLKPNGTFDLSKVTSLVAPPIGCTNSQGESGWGTWSIQNRTSTVNYPYPTSTGVIFVEDNLWVDGTANDRLTIASGRFPEQSSTNSDIIVNGNLLYSTTSAALGLIAQGNVRIGLRSSSTQEIDGALIAKNKGTIRNYYRSNCGTGYLQTKLISKGMQATNTSGYFAWANSGGTVVSGYQTQQTIYDASFLYGPPPSFPLTGAQYVQISWDEVQ